MNPPDVWVQELDVSHPAPSPCHDTYRRSASLSPRAVPKLPSNAYDCKSSGSKALHPTAARSRHRKTPSQAASRPKVPLPQHTQLLIQQLYSALNLESGASFSGSPAHKGGRTKLRTTTAHQWNKRGALGHRDKRLLPLQPWAGSTSKVEAPQAPAQHPQCLQPQPASGPGLPLSYSKYLSACLCAY